MKQIIALACILILCAGLLIYSFADRNVPVASPVVPVMATPDEPEQLRATQLVTEPTSQPTTEPVTEPVATPDEPRQETARFVFYNDHPVLQLIYDQLSEEFFQQTGIRVVTISSMANLADQSPALFSVSDGVPPWACLDLSDTVAYANLACDCFTLKVEDQVMGIANEVEPFGLIYNTALLARVGYTGADIHRFTDLKTVVNYITLNAETLGFGAFEPAEDEFLGAIPGDTQQLLDLYIENPAPGDMLSSAAVFGFGTLSDMERLSSGGELQLDMLPLYTGAPGEESQGVHCIVNSYWCVREDAPEAEIQSALAFLNFLVSPRMDGTVPVDDLCLLAPYRQAIYARNSVQQRFRNDVAQGKECIVCELY